MKTTIVTLSDSDYIKELSGIIAENKDFEMLPVTGGVENACAEAAVRKADALLFEGTVADAELVKRIFDSFGLSPAIFVAAEEYELKQLQTREEIVCIPLGKGSDVRESARFVITNLKILSDRLVNNHRRSLSNYVTRILIGGNIKPSYYGFRLLRDAITYCVENRSFTALGKEVYQEIARRYNTTATAVERNIRTIIDRCWEASPENFCANFFGIPCTSIRQKPTAKEFISTVSERMLLELD